MAKSGYYGAQPLQNTTAFTPPRAPLVARPPMNRSVGPVGRGDLGSGRPMMPVGRGFAKGGPVRPAGYQAGGAVDEPMRMAALEQDYGGLATAGRHYDPPSLVDQVNTVKGEERYFPHTPGYFEDPPPLPRRRPKKAPQGYQEGGLVTSDDEDKEQIKKAEQDDNDVYAGIGPKWSPDAYNAFLAELAGELGGTGYAEGGLVRGQEERHPLGQVLDYTRKKFRLHERDDRAGYAYGGPVADDDDDAGRYDRTGYFYDGPGRDYALERVLDEIYDPSAPRGSRENPIDAGTPEIRAKQAREREARGGVDYAFSDQEAPDRDAARTMAPALLEADNPPARLSDRTEPYTPTSRTPRLRSSAEPLTGESGIVPLLGAAVGKAYSESRHPAPERDSFEGAGVLADVGRGIAGGIADIYGSFKDRLAAYIRGDAGHSPETVAKSYRDAEAATPDASHNSNTQSIFDKAFNAGDVEEASQIVQSRRQPFDRARAVGVAALANGNLDAAARAFDASRELVPNNTETKSTVTPDGNIVVAVTDQNGRTWRDTLTPQEFEQRLKDGHFDEVAENGHKPTPTSEIVPQTGYSAPANSKYGPYGPRVDWRDEKPVMPGGARSSPAALAGTRQSFAPTGTRQFPPDAGYQYARRERPPRDFGPSGYRGYLEAGGNLRTVQREVDRGTDRLVRMEQDKISAASRRTPQMLAADRAVQASGRGDYFSAGTPLPVGAGPPGGGPPTPTPPGAGMDAESQSWLKYPHPSQAAERKQYQAVLENQIAHEMLDRGKPWQKQAAKDFLERGIPWATQVRKDELPPETTVRTPASEALSMFGAGSQNQGKRRDYEIARTRQAEVDALEREKLASNERKGELTNDQRIELERLKQTGANERARMRAASSDARTEALRDNNWVTNVGRRMNARDRDALHEIASQRNAAAQLGKDFVPTYAQQRVLERAFEIDESGIDFSQPVPSARTGGQSPAAARTEAGPRAATAPAAAVDALQKNPSLRAQFDAKYGVGAADRILGGR